MDASSVSSPILSRPAAAPSTSCNGIGFLSLAPELRNAIYEEVYKEVDYPAEIEIFAARRLVPQSALTMTCRTVRRESLPYLRSAEERFHDSRTFFFEIDVRRSCQYVIRQTEQRVRRFPVPPASRIQFRFCEVRNSSGRIKSFIVELSISEVGEVVSDTWNEETRGEQQYPSWFAQPLDRCFKQSGHRALICGSQPDKLNVSRCLEVYLACLQGAEMKQGMSGNWWSI